MKRIAALLALFAVIAEPALVLANPCQVCRKRIVKNVKQVKVVKQFAVTKIYPTYAATFIPPAPIVIAPGQTTVGQQAYSVTQTQGYGLALQTGAAIQSTGQAQQVQAPSELAQVLAELKGLCKRIDALEAGPAAVRAPSGVPKVLALKCAACHNATVAEQDGGGFVMFDKGRLADFSERDIRLMLTKVTTGTMPPPDNRKGIKPVTDQEASEIAQWIETLK